MSKPEPLKNKEISSIKGDELPRFEYNLFTKEDIASAVEWLKQELEDLQLELFLTDLKDKTTGEIIDIPKDLRIVLENYVAHIQPKIKKKIDKAFEDITKEQK